MKVLLTFSIMFTLVIGLFSPVTGQDQIFDPFGGGFPLDYDAEIFTLGTQNDSLHGWGFWWDSTFDSILLVGDESFPEPNNCGEIRDVAHGDFNGDFMDELVVAWNLSDGGIFVGIPTIDPITMEPGPPGWHVPNVSIEPGVLYATDTLADILGEIRVVAGNFYPDHAMEFVLAYLAADSTVTLSVFDVDTVTLIPEEMATISNQAVNTDLPALQQFGVVSRFDIAAGDFDGDGLDEIALVVNDPAVSPTTDLVLRIYHYDTLSHDLIPEEKILYFANSDVDHPCLRNVLIETGNFEPDSLDEIAILDSWSRSDVDSSRVGTLHTVKLTAEMDDIYDSQMQLLPSCSGIRVQAWPNDAGLNGPVHIMTIYDNKLIVGGSFTVAGGIAANNIASWDGARWKPLGAGVDSTVEALEVYEGDLIVGGSFTEAGGVPANHLARWDGTSWEEFGGGANNTVFDLLASTSVSPDTLFACGDFTMVGDTSASRIARWDGSVWQKVATGLNDRALEMMDLSDRIVVTGAFHWIDDTDFDRWHIVYWLPSNPTVWNYYGKGFFNNDNNEAGYGHALEHAPDGDLIAGGLFTHVWGLIVWAQWRSANNLGIYGEDGYWHPIGLNPPGANDWIHDLLFDESDNTLLYAGGRFTTVQGIAASGIGQWHWPSGPWQPLGSGVTATTDTAEVWDMCSYRGDLVAGGKFDHAGGIGASNIARWDGSRWQSLSYPLPMLPVGLAVGRFNADSGLDDIAIAACRDSSGIVRRYVRVYGIDTLSASLTLCQKWDTTIVSDVGMPEGLARSRRIIAVDDVNGNGQSDLAVLRHDNGASRVAVYEPEPDPANICMFDSIILIGSSEPVSENMTQLILADLDTVTTTIGPPMIYQVQNLIQPLAIINAPPAHFDILDGVIYDVSDRYPLSLNEDYDTYVEYYVSTVIDTETVSTIHNDWGVSAGLEAWAYAGGTGVEGYLEGEYGDGFSKKCDTSVTISVGSLLTARSDDKVKAVTLNYDILEYPVLHGGVLVGHVLVANPFTQSLSTGWNPGEDEDYFMPNHEVDNILSYPRLADITNNPMMESGVIGNTTEYYTLDEDAPSHWYLGYQTFVSSDVTNSWDASTAAGASYTYGAAYEVEAGFAGNGVSTEISWGAKASISGNYDWGAISTVSSSYNELDSLHVQMGMIISTPGYSDNRRYKVIPYAYWAKNGAFVIDYAAEPGTPSDPPNWWQIHYSQPDPALILPKRLDNEKWGTQEPDENRRETKEIIFYPDFPAPGDSVIVGARVHNFSLVPTLSPVAVSFYLGNPTNGGMILQDKNSGDSIFYTHDTTGAPVTIAAQGNAFASMVWQVPDVGSISSCQRIWALIDPLDEISPEVHDNDDSLTNNKGWRLLYVNTPVDCIDTDGDGWEDPAFRCSSCPHKWDNCPTVINPEQEDSDYDGIGDSCEVITYICGDASGNGAVNILDATYLISYLYKGGPAPDPEQAADVNSSSSINILDVTYLINYLYKGGPAPNCP